MISRYHRVWAAAVLTALVICLPLTSGFVVQPSTLSTRQSLTLSVNLRASKNGKKTLRNKSVDADIQQQIQTFDPFREDGYLSPVLGSAVDELEEEKNIGLWAARGLLLLVAMLWGTNFASVKYLETLCFHPPCNHSPSEAALARFGVAALISIPVLIGKRLDIILAGLECGLWVTLGYITQAEALRYIDSGTCAFICSLTVVVVPLFERLFGKPLKKTSIISAIVALAGVAVLEGIVDVESMMQIQPALADTTTVAASTTTATDAAGAALTEAVTTTTTAAVAVSKDWLASLAQVLGVSKGDIIALGQPLGFGVSFLRIEQYVEKFEDEKDRVLTIAAAECVAVGLFALMWVLIDFHGEIPNMEYMLEPHRLAAIGWTGIMTTLVAIYFEGVALQTASATDAAITFASEPVWASLFGAWLLREKLGVSDYVGGTIITLACLIGAAGDLLAAPKEDSESEE